MAKKDEVRVKSRSGVEYGISTDGNHYSATKDGVAVGQAYVEVINLLKDLDIEVKAYDDAVAGIELEPGKKSAPTGPETGDDVGHTCSETSDEAIDSAVPAPKHMSAASDDKQPAQPEVLGVNND